MCIPEFEFILLENLFCDQESILSILQMCHLSSLLHLTLIPPINLHFSSCTALWKKCSCRQQPPRSQTSEDTYCNSVYWQEMAEAIYLVTTLSSGLLESNREIHVGEPQHDIYNVWATLITICVCKHHRIYLSAPQSVHSPQLMLQAWSHLRVTL